MTIMKWRISEQGHKHLGRFSTFVLFKPTASTMQKINPVGCFNLCHWKFVYILLFREDKSNNVFREIRKCFRKTEKFEFFAKQIIYLESPDHPLENDI